MSLYQRLVCKSCGVPVSRSGAAVLGPCVSCGGEMRPVDAAPLDTLAQLVNWGWEQGLVLKSDELWKEGTSNRGPDPGGLTLTARGWSDLNTLEALAIKAGVWDDDSEEYGDGWRWHAS